jgi:hypothetical protein
VEREVAGQLGQNLASWGHDPADDLDRTEHIDGENTPMRWIGEIRVWFSERTRSREQGIVRELIDLLVIVRVVEEVAVTGTVVAVSGGQQSLLDRIDGLFDVWSVLVSKFDLPQSRGLELLGTGSG